MIARIWHGAVRVGDAEEYAEYIEATGLAEYTRTEGNRGAYMLRRDDGELAHFTTLSFWENMDAVKGFAGEEPERAVFYPDDDRYLVQRDERVHHHVVTSASGPPPQ